MAKNNFKEVQWKMSHQKQRWGLRKLSVGVASVLLGTTMYLGAGNVAHADTVSENNVDVSEQTTSTAIDDSTTVKLGSSESGSTVAHADTEAPATEQTTNNVSVDTTSGDQQEQSATDLQTNSDSEQTPTTETATISDLSSAASTTTIVEDKTSQPAANMPSAQSDSQAISDDATAQTQQVKVTFKGTMYGDDFTKDITLTDGEDIQTALQKEIDQDNATQNKSNSYVEDVDYNTTNLSPLAFQHIDTKHGADLDGTGVLADAYAAWKARKEKEFPLAGYHLGDVSGSSSEGYVVTLQADDIKTIGTNVWKSFSRDIIYRKYYGKNDTKDSDPEKIYGRGVDDPLGTAGNLGTDTVTYVPDGSRNTESANSGDGNSDKPNMPGLTIPKTEHNEVLIYNVLKLRYNPATGTLNVSLHKHGGDTVPDNALIIQFDGKAINEHNSNYGDSWSTLAKNVEKTGDMYEEEGTYGQNYDGIFFNGVDKNGNDIPAYDPPTVYVIYYHDQPVQVQFEDVTDQNNPKALSTFNAPDISWTKSDSTLVTREYSTTVDDKGDAVLTDSNTNDDKGDDYVEDTDKYSYKSGAYTQEGKLSTDANAAKANKAINELSSVDFSNVLNAYLINGYALVSEDDDNLTYKADEVWSKDTTDTANNGHKLNTLTRTIKLKRVAHEVGPINKTVTRTVNYVADDANHTTLQPSVTQSVTYHRDGYYVDNAGNPVNTEDYTYTDAQGKSHTVKVVAGTTSAPAWTITKTNNAQNTTIGDSYSVFGNENDDVINIKDGANKGKWTVTQATQNNAPSETLSTDDNETEWSKAGYTNDGKDNYTKDVTLIYHQTPVSYSVHYRDVTGVNRNGNYQPTDGKAIVGHDIENINGVVGGDTPDESNKLWSKADYEKAGYILVQQDSNLAKQPLTENVSDQYVYLVHAYEPKETTEVQHRVIKYFDGQTGESLSKMAVDVTQDVSFKQMAIYDKVTGDFLGYNTTGAVDAYGRLIPETQDESKSWMAVDDNGQYSSVVSPDLTSAHYKKVPSFKLGEDNADAATAPSEQAVAGKDGQEIDIYYFHQTEPVNESETVNETVRYWYKDSGKQAEPDYKAKKLTFTRTGTKDLVTNETKWNDWTNDQTFDRVVSPTIKGYTVDKKQIDKQTVSHDSKDLVFNVYYDKLPDKDINEGSKVTETIHYIYKNGPKAGQKASDDVNKTLSFSRTGKQDQATDKITWNSWNDNQKFSQVDSPKIKGYDVDQVYVPEYEVNHDSDNIEVTVYYSIEPDKDVSQNKQVHETIHYVYGDGPKKGQKVFDDYVAEPLTFTQNGKQSPVDDTITWGNWSGSQNFNAVTSPIKKGYHYDKSSIDKQTVDHNSNDLEFTVYYYKDAPTPVNESKTVNETVHYWYKGSGKPAANDYNAKPLTFTREGLKDAETGEVTWGDWTKQQTFDEVDSPEIKGYQVDKKQIDEQTVSHDSEDLVFNVYYDKLPDKDVSESDVVNETIHYIYEDGATAAPDYKTSTSEFTHQGKQDQVTDKITWQDWSGSQTLKSVKSPEIKGYTADKLEISQQTVKYDDNDLVYTVVYRKNAPTPVNESKMVNETVHYWYKDSGKQAAPDYKAQALTFTRKGLKDAVTDDVTWDDWTADQTFSEVDSPEIKGYTVDKKQIDKQTVNHDSKDLVFDVYYDKLPDKAVNENSHVIETIHYVYKNGPKAGQTAAPDATQTLNFSRNGEQSPVDNTITWGEWNDGQQFKAIASPSIKGYDVDQPQIEAITVNHDSDNIEKTVYYTIQSEKPTPTPAKYTVTVHYEDDRGNTIKDPVIDGDNYQDNDPYSTTDHKPTTINFNNQTYELIALKTDSAPETGTIKEQNVDVTYVYKLKTPDTPTPDVPQTPDKPTTPGTQTLPAQPAPTTPGDQPLPALASVEPGTPTQPLTSRSEKTQPATQLTPQGLPQTGNDNESAVVALGLSLMTAAAGLLGFKKREN